MFQAKLKMPRDLSLERKMERVEDILEQVSLEIPVLGFDWLDTITQQGIFSQTSDSMLWVLSKAVAGEMCRCKDR